jgi:hypothetical protein
MAGNVTGSHDFASGFAMGAAELENTRLPPLKKTSGKVKYFPHGA